MGIVVNQSLNISLSDMLAHLDIEAIPECPDTPILAGGPVATDHGFVLHRGDPGWEGSQAVTESSQSYRLPRYTVCHCGR